MNQPSPGGTTHTTERPIPYESIVQRHNALISRARDVDDAKIVEDVYRFMRDAAQAGKWLDSPAERRAVQGELSYWTTFLFRKQLSASEGTLADFDPKAAVPLEIACPYPGLRAYGLIGREDLGQDIVNFFGREREITECCQYLESNTLLAIIAGSGTGKSSLAMAGVLAHITESSLPGWLCAQRMTPGSEPLSALLHALDTVLGLQGAPRLGELLNVLGTTELPSQSASHTASVLVELLAGKRVLIFVDQFEELYSLCRDFRQRVVFANIVCRLAALEFEDASPFRLLITMRTDHVHFAESLTPDLYILLRKRAYYLEPLTINGVRQVIAQPAKRVGLRFVPYSIVEELATQTASLAAGLPLLQFALRKLWFGRRRNEVNVPLDIVDVTDVERLVHAQPGTKPDAVVERALSFAADQLYRDLNSEQQGICKRLFLELTEISDNFEDPLRRRRGELDLTETVAGHLGVSREDVVNVISRLVESELLLRTVSTAPGQSAAATELEVAHEALFRHWNKFRVAWLPDAKGDLLRVKTVEREAAEWEKSARSEEQLKQRGRELEVAEGLSNTGWLSEVAREYVSQCRTWEDSLVRTAKDAKNSKARNRWLFAVTCGCIVVAVIFGVLWVRTWSVETITHAYSEIERHPADGLKNSRTVARALTMMPEGARIKEIATIKELRTVLANAANLVEVGGKDGIAALDRTGSALMSLPGWKPTDNPTIRILNVEHWRGASPDAAPKWYEKLIPVLGLTAQDLAEARLNHGGTRALIRYRNANEELIEIFEVSDARAGSARQLASYKSPLTRFDRSDFSDDGDWFVIAGTRESREALEERSVPTVILYDVQHHTEVSWSPPADHEWDPIRYSRVSALAVSDGGRFVAVGFAVGPNAGETVLVQWKPTRGAKSPRAEILSPFFGGQVTDVRFRTAPNGPGWVAAAGWATRSSSTATAEPPLNGQVMGRFAPSDPKGSEQGPDRSLVVQWMISDGEKSLVSAGVPFTLPVPSVEKFSLSSDGTRLLTVGSSIMAVWDTANMADGASMIELFGPAGLIQAVFSDDGKSVLALRSTGGTDPRHLSPPVLYRYPIVVEMPLLRRVGNSDVPLPLFFGTGYTGNASRALGDTNVSHRLRLVADRQGEVAAYVHNDPPNVTIGLRTFPMDESATGPVTIPWSDRSPEFVSIVKSGNDIRAAFASSSAVKVLTGRMIHGAIVPNPTISTLAPLPDALGQSPQITCVAMARDRSRLLIATNDGQDFLRDGPSWNPSSSEKSTPENPGIQVRAGIGACAITRDGNTTATGDLRGWIEVSSSAPDDHLSSNFIWLGGSVRIVNFSDNGKYLLAFVPSQSKVFVIAKNDNWEIVKEQTVNDVFDVNFLARGSDKLPPQFAKVRFDGSQVVYECWECMSLDELSNL